MKFKRLSAGAIAIMILLSSFILNANATQQPDESLPETSATVSATIPPTEPPVTVEQLGYKGYVQQLEKTYYKGNLGATYKKSSTTFKVWAPTAEDVKVCIYRTGTDSEQYAEMLSKTTMKFSKKYGTWYINLKGDYKNKYYTYLVTVNGESHEVVDPYAKAVGANGDRGMVVDLKSTNPKGWSKDSFKRVSSPTDAIIWEVNIRDFSASPSSGVSEKNRGKFLAFTEEGTVVDSKSGSLSTCIDYLKQLNVNYVQINPFYDFASIDETKPLDKQYNWGYDPKNYNVPEGSYSSNPYNGNTRITECKKMIQALHKAGIGVIMDVVYNHTYESKDSFLNQIVPDYYYRINEDGEWSDGSGCGNDTASERVMFREFMKNSVLYWAEEYHIDGFRFDLMGLHDVDTMNYIRASLDKLKDGSRILMYGEAWNMSTYCDSDTLLANQDNMSELSTRIGAFNDTTRDGIKGNVFTPSDKGFVQSAEKKSAIRIGITAQQSPDGWSAAPRQCVNYASCHDNLTLYDKLMVTEYPDTDDFRLRKEDLVSMNKLSSAIVLTSQGIPFMLAGEEMGRSKDGDDNSYKSSVELNQIDWTNLNKFASLNEYYKGLISIRKTVDLLRDPDKKYVNKVKYIENTDSDVIAYTISDDTASTKSVAVILNGSDKDASVTIDKGIADSWTLIANDSEAGLKSLKTITDNKVSLKPNSCSILVDTKSFNSYKNKDTDCKVIVTYHDKTTDSVVYEQVLKGKKGEKFEVYHPDSLLFKYNITSEKGELQGVFTDETQYITVNCKQYSGDFSTVTLHYVNEYGDNIADSIVMSNRVGQQYYTPKIEGVYGYKLDLSKLPTNGAGEYAKDNIDITYTYNTIEITSEQSSTDPDVLKDSMDCYANVIYMSDKGEILETKSYKGTKDDKVEINYLSFDGYTYVSDTGENAVFNPVETNIVVNYSSDKSFAAVVIIVSSVLAAFALIVILAFIIRKTRSNKPKDDDMLIEE